ncbi:hypothetical protein [Aquabacterium sp.]|uniref:hypothetical protein n=1 Tax=Aquabacterium sp. TaxID=1872578 RepID=UPI00378366FC
MATALLAACGTAPAPRPAAPAPAPVAATAATPLATTAPPAAAALPPTRRARDWNEYRVLAALRIVAASRERSYDGPVPEPLLAIPVLEVELNGDGSVRNIKVLRKPRQATDTVQLAIDAVHRAAPFGDVRHLPRPWRFSEVFLFNDDRRFKPSSLDL